ncbi:sigma-54-dependent Fis family transcriptional regulator [Bacillus sp. EB600]|uniref:sigma-54 interaction domain-containing protein n=1 Tax=Bacillus sp. EB600 TaxID=2806345 RepID=UPI00210BF3D0|nr:sigma 54-interacting transcriptional regulator [Bacillus sp. EB600]MCQ6281570.1 sigma 54-interacting transcriptional regulator [Bacillus sp. EB600]
MEKAIHLIEDWGYLEVDDSGRLIYVSLDFCEHFSINRNDILGGSIHDVIHGMYGRKRKRVFFGVISGINCIIRVTKKGHREIYRVLVRDGDIEHYEMVSFMHTIDLEKMNKKKPHQNKYSFEEIIGNSQAINNAKELATRIATSNSTVLLTGESGTGKELFAQAIHGISTRKNNPFIAVNCAAIPGELFESELFGYEPGAFSGAKKEGKPGKIELAMNGTLFLDEISELPYEAQGKLLRVLQEKEVERVGGTVSKHIDIRIIAATNRDLGQLVEEGKFRQDLFYRLYVFDLTIPSLRERVDDILPLAFYFIDYFNLQFDLEVKHIDSKLHNWMLNYDWPGNVRELKAVIERGMNIVEGDTLSMNDLYFSTQVSTNPTNRKTVPLQSLEEEVRAAEINAIQRALQEADGDRSLAAQKLKIHIASLYRKIAKYNLK